jgi:PKD repeat protein
MKKIFQIIILSALTVLFTINDISAQTMMAIPTPSTSYSGMTRGYWFQAPCNFNIVGLKVPTNYSTANSWLTVVDFGSTPPPVYSLTTNLFTTLSFLQNIAGTTMIPVNIPIISGHYIGIMGCRASPGLSNYTAVTTSYATSINSVPTTLYRLGMQFDLSTSTGPHDLWYEVAGTIAVVEMYYSVNNFAIDAGVSAITRPVGAISPGVDTVKCTLKNWGNDTIKSVGLRWSVDGIIQASPSNWTGALVKNSTTGQITFGAYNFVGGAHKIKAWTVSPNGKTDSFAINDTVISTVQACQLLSGTYIVDKSGAGNYLTITDAVNALGYCGINGPVTIKIRPGIYSERLVIPTVSGASAINTITFDGGSADSTKIVYSVTTSTAYAVISLNGADYITIKNLTLENTDLTYACGVHFGSKADYNTIENCKIDLGTTSTNTTTIAILGCAAESSPTGYGDAGNYNTIKNNRIIGGCYSIKFLGTTTTALSIGNTFLSNTTEQYYSYGAYFYYQKNLLYKYNRVLKPRNASAYGVYGYYTYNSVYDANIIHPGYYGMVIGYNQNVAPDSTVVSNNIITNFLNGTQQIGIYNPYSFRTYFLNNSVWCDGTYTTTTTYGCFYNYYSQNNVLKNNIFKSTGNLPCYVSNAIASIASGAIDYNNYIASSTAYIAYNYSLSTAYATLALWKVADPTQNLNSLTLEPNFVDYKDLHLQPSSPMMFGLIMAFTNDVDGDNRCSISTSLGADEFHYPALPPQVGFTSPDTSCENTPVYFWNNVSANDVTKNAWFVDGILKSTALNYSYTPIAMGSYTISLITANCYGSDTFSKVITVVSPTTSPVSDFVISRNRVKIGEMVKLNDLTTDCPSAWNWEIMPDTTLDLITGLRQPSYTFLNGTSLSSPSPELQFNYSGFYDVTLTTSNTIGVGTTESKINYISVVFSAAMCIGANKTEETEGYLYDNGGKSLNYTANKFCTYTIHPCATTVTLNFLKFNLTSGDYVRIYDGTDNKGTPLWNKKSYPSGMGNAIQASFPTDSAYFTSLSGALYIEFETDATLLAEGFEAVWTSTQGNFTAPIASFTTADSNCNGSHVFFENTSTGDDNKYFWDFDNNGQYESNLENPYWIYKADGKNLVRLAVVNCGGTDTTSKVISIFTSKNRPAFDIETSNNRPNMGIEIVTLTGYATTYCIDSFSWFITPNSYTIKTGNIHDNALDIIFKDSVCYDVTLISGYRGMMDTVVKPCFVRPIEYCIPNFAYFTPDIGISRVTFNDIDQVSEPGKKPYEDFTNTKTSLLEQGATYSFSVSRTTNYNFIQRKIWIDYNIDGDFNDPGELVAIDTLSNTLTWTGSVTIPITTIPGISRLRVGVSAINQQFGPCSILNNGEYEDYSVMLSTVITPPVITIIGSTQINVNECGAYTDQGATAVNKLGGPVTVVSAGTVDPKVPATYYIRYNAKDQFGNKAIEKVRTVIVVPDNIAPVLVLNGKIYDTIVVKNSFTDLGYAATDNCSGVDTTYVSNNLNINILGSYTISYECFDKRGNTAKKSRHIEVIDNIPPVITVFDPDTIFMEVNTALNPRVLKITDNYYTTFAIIISGTFYQNFNTGLATSIGKYTIIYDVIDGSGNMVTKTFWIKVGDQTSPVIVLNGSSIISLCRYDTFAEEGYVVEDNVDASPKVVRAGSYFTDYLVHYANGTYEIQYTATDKSNNYSYASRLIYVSDSDACASSIVEGRKKDYKVYPNPSTGKLNIDINYPGSENTTIEIYNVLGKMVYSRVFRNIKLIQVDLSNVSTGIYNVQLISNGVKRNTNINIIH